MILPLTTSLFLLSNLAVVTGCASYFKRKECEKTNWFEHGRKVAMSGRRLDADDLIKQCQKAEGEVRFSDADLGFKAGMAAYCENDNVFLVGKSGKPFSFDMCDGEKLARMKARHSEGLKVFCTPTRAFTFGKDGGIYENVCPSAVEDAWLVEYRRGRKIYLHTMLQVKEREAQRLGLEAASLESRRQFLTVQQRQLLGVSTEKREQVFDPATGRYREQVSRAPDARAEAQRQSLLSETNSVNWDLDRKRRQMDALNDEVMKLRTEMETL